MVANKSQYKTNVTSEFNGNYLVHLEKVTEENSWGFLTFAFGKWLVKVLFTIKVVWAPVPFFISV